MIYNNALFELSEVLKITENNICYDCLVRKIPELNKINDIEDYNNFINSNNFNSNNSNNFNSNNFNSNNSNSNNFNSNNSNSNNFNSNNSNSNNDNERNNENINDIIKNIKNIKNNNDFNECEICKGVLPNFDIKTIINKINDKIEYLNLEFKSFLVGSKLPKEIVEIDDFINEKIGIESINIKKDINIRIGEALEDEWGLEVDFNNPDIVVMVDFRRVFETIENSGDDIDKTIFEDVNIRIQINPIFIEGRYLKFLRTIPQTKWPCRKCKGKGCDECNFTGKKYQESVEELLSNVAIKIFNGYKSKFHGAGREDIDVRMLGNGRPFVLEILEPKTRFVDLEKLEKDANEYSNGKTEYLNLKYTNKSRKAEIKVSSPNTYKVYRALVECEMEIDKDKLNLLKSLKTIHQTTPQRVLHRRADKIRIKEVKDLKYNLLSPTSFEMIIKTEGGLYIKELISSDDGRTKPSVSEILDNNSICKELDVIEVGIK
ncbi:MAG: tRNA pseudouridine(54/55) synthase Pus10 [Methanobrevibacter sp.]|jgi:tRNA pseudouridine synthase 10|nr:tRNA pseudouridine(54/55) synthase Pus10 [Candidatus Methanoflexus mossambicus]